MNKNINDKSQTCEKGDNIELLKTLDPIIKEFQTNFRLINSNYSLTDFENVLNPIEYAEFNSFLAYFICSLFYSYLKISGNLINNDHPIKKELKKVQLLMKEIKEKNQKSNKQNNQEKQTIKLNKDATKRIIDSCVSYNNDLKKRKCKEDE
ncbi:conserved Plasmodium protein, unknown function [Plasmodium chabaudi adami]|uniref:Nuclear nucleic acid-binding protein C1D n=1 Tax=Plasmodium chabaudi adami TaxID=5826 RepID=A0A1C6XUH6_PLACE|nr:conserved Plasmodium protein, unknown function [Plasmodium chabaudi adami]